MCWKPVPDWLASCRQVEWTSSSTSPVRHSGRLLSLFFSFLFYSHISPVHLGAQQQTSPGQSRRSFELEEEKAPRCSVFRLCKTTTCLSRSAGQIGGFRDDTQLSVCRVHIELEFTNFWLTDVGHWERRTTRHTSSASFRLISGRRSEDICQMKSKQGESPAI